MSQLPICRSGADLARFDGQRVTLVGIYRKRMVPNKMGQPATQFYGHAQIELTGAIVRIGTDKRPEDEIEKLADQKVAVEGRLVLQPPIADPNVASALPPPTLFDIGTITQRD